MYEKNTRTKKKLKKGERGITLIALVVTIIVLLILAGISISMLSGNNGVLQRATDAKTKSDEAQIKERIQLAYHSALTGGQGSYTKESLEDELKKEFGEDFEEVDDSNDTNWVLKAKGQSVTIPAGEIDLSVDTTWQQAFEFPSYNFNSYILDNEKKTLTIQDGPPITSENVEIKSYAVIDGVKYTTKFPDSANHLFVNGKFKTLTIDAKIDTSNVTNMYQWFINCENLEILNISGFNTSNVTNMEYLFWNCCKLEELDLSNFDTSNVEKMENIFGVSENIDEESNLRKIIVSDKFVTTKVADDTPMFDNCTKLVGGNGTTYDNSKIDKTMAHIDTAENPGYFTAK